MICCLCYPRHVWARRKLQSMIGIPVGVGPRKGLLLARITVIATSPATSRPSNSGEVWLEHHGDVWLCCAVDRRCPHVAQLGILRVPSPKCGWCDWTRANPEVGQSGFAFAFLHTPHSDVTTGGDASSSDVLPTADWIWNAIRRCRCLLALWCCFPRNLANEGACAD